MSNKTLLYGFTRDHIFPYYCFGKKCYSFGIYWSKLRKCFAKYGFKTDADEVLKTMIHNSNHIRFFGIIKTDKQTMSKLLFPDGSIGDSEFKPKEIEFEIKRDSDFAKMFEKLMDEHKKEVEEFEEKITKHVDDLIEEMFDTEGMSEEGVDFLKEIANVFFRCGWNGCYIFHKERIERI